MNGDSTGLEPADSSGAGDPGRRWRDALTVFNQTAKTACDLGEHKLQREAEDAAARAVGVIEALNREAALAARKGLSRSEGVHGEDSPQAPQVMPDC